MSEAKKHNQLPSKWLGLWPGLPQLWLSGSFAGLSAAVSYAVLLDFVLATTLVWTEIWEPRAAWLWWAGTAAVWSGSAGWWLAWGRRRWTEESTDMAGDLFPDALAEYLRGNWFEADRLVDRLLRRCPQDVEARLLRVSILRRTGKLGEARRLLDVLGRTEAATKWQFEIERERETLERPLGDEDSRSAIDAVVNEAA